MSRKVYLTRSLFPRLVGIALQVGVDSTHWSFGQHGGLSWTLMDKTDDHGGLRQIGIWPDLKTAEVGLQGMIDAFQEVVVTMQNALGRT